MDARAFVTKWRGNQAKETARSQTHFNDLCRLLGLPEPLEADPTGKEYGFEIGMKISGGGQGFADVAHLGRFAWEYKGQHADLDKAYAQLRRYADALNNPPYLIVSDIERTIVRTNFTNTVTKTHEFMLDDLLLVGKRSDLKSILEGSDLYRPKETKEELTQKITATFANLAESLREGAPEVPGHDPEAVALFVSRLAFCMFAEDTRVIPEGIFSRMLNAAWEKPEEFPTLCGSLFSAMARKGGRVGFEPVPWINGGLFEDSGEAAGALPLTRAQIGSVRAAAKPDWADVDFSILGTLFERGLDPKKRGQLGAHYTDEASILRIVEPVVIAPLEREWAEVRAEIEALPVPVLAPLTPAREAATIRSAITRATRARTERYEAFRARLAAVRVLDPACGSGNFLYVALKRLRDLELRVMDDALALGLPAGLPRVGPANVMGLEISEYAAELARLSVWIGDLQWGLAHGFGVAEPVLGHLDSIRRHDALLNEDGTEFEWPAAEFIVGNPPFLGSNLMNGGLGTSYTSALRSAYAGRVPGGADLCTYWFEKSRVQIAAGQTGRAGLIATQSIRGGASRLVLERIVDSGAIFEAWSDEPWILEGANVHISIVGFDGGVEVSKRLNGEPTPSIGATLSVGSEVHHARNLPPNRSISFQGAVRIGDFNLSHDQALVMLSDPNPHGRPNSDVLRPTLNGGDNTGRSRGEWVIDFNAMPQPEAALYESPFARLATYVQPFRATNPRPRRRETWWLHGELASGWRRAMEGKSRFLALTQTAKYVLFRHHDAIVSPEQTIIAFAADDDFFFGIVQSRIHQIWATTQGTQLEDRPRYTPTTSFETFPLIEPTDDQRETITTAAHQLDTLRERWLNPPEWTREETVAFPATVGGPWHRHIPGSEMLTMGATAEAKYQRRVALPSHASELKRRTLTSLYNLSPDWLRNAHQTLDDSVASAYGFSTDLSAQKVLSALLERNLDGEKTSA